MTANRLHQRGLGMMTVVMIVIAVTAAALLLKRCSGLSEDKPIDDANVLRFAFAFYSKPATVEELRLSRAKNLCSINVLEKVDVPKTAEMGSMSYAYSATEGYTHLNMNVSAQRHDGGWN